MYEAARRRVIVQRAMDGRRNEKRPRRARGILFTRRSSFRCFFAVRNVTKPAGWKRRRCRRRFATKRFTKITVRTLSDGFNRTRTNSTVRKSDAVCVCVQQNALVRYDIRSSEYNGRPTCTLDVSIHRDARVSKFVKPVSARGRRCGYLANIRDRTSAVAFPDHFFGFRMSN